MSAAGGATGIIAALGEELAALTRRLRASERLRLPGLTGYRGRLGGRPVVLAATGDGPERASRGLRALLGGAEVDRLVVVGVSGALTADLAPASLLLARRVVAEDGEVLDPDPRWLAEALGTGVARGGTVLTARRILATPRDKADARAALAEEAGPAAVDLESAAFARAAAAGGVPWLVLRSISDAADEALPGDLEGCRGPDGAVDRTRVVRQAARWPWIVPGLLRLSQRVARCSRGLADAVETLLALGLDREASATYFAGQSVGAATVERG